MAKAKRKAPESEESGSEGQASPPPKSKKGKATTKSSKESSNKSTPTIKKPKFEQDDDSSDSSTTADDAVVKTNSDGEKYIDIGKKRRATVRTFKNIPLLDIREFYGEDGDEKPGKKGISLTLEQWETLRDSASEIDSLFASQKK